MSWEDRREPWTPQPEDARSAWDVDYGRIIHSASFRRLQGKTQVLNLGDSDFYRTRLTHSIEVGQVAGGIVKQLAQKFPDHEATSSLPDRTLIQAIGFTHDLGHPPFGHGGEVALNYCMRNQGGFEGNGQTLRILAKLENFSKAHGSNLARRTLLGVLKYPVPYSNAANPKIVPSLSTIPTTIHLIDRKSSKPPKCYLDSEQAVVDWVLEPLQSQDRVLFTVVLDEKDEHGKAKEKSFDCSVMDMADDIAYGVHDLEDAIALKLITEDEFRSAVDLAACASFTEALRQKYPKEVGNDAYELVVKQLFGSSATRKHCINRLVHHFVSCLEIETRAEFQEPLLRYRVTMPEGHRRFLKALKRVVMNEVILSPSVQHLEFKGQAMVVSVFEALITEPQALLARDAYAKYSKSQNDPRVICDHVAGMTDAHLMKTYERLFSPREGSVFDKL